MVHAKPDTNSSISNLLTVRDRVQDDFARQSDPRFTEYTLKSLDAELSPEHCIEQVISPKPEQEDEELIAQPSHSSDSYIS